MKAEDEAEVAASKSIKPLSVLKNNGKHNDNDWKKKR
jgi:hypothetical protein